MRLQFESDAPPPKLRASLRAVGEEAPFTPFDRCFEREFSKPPPGCTLRLTSGWDHEGAERAHEGVLDFENGGEPLYARLFVHVIDPLE